MEYIKKIIYKIIVVVRNAINKYKIKFLNRNFVFEEKSWLVKNVFENKNDNYILLAYLQIV